VEQTIHHPLQAPKVQYNGRNNPRIGTLISKLTVRSVLILNLRSS